MAVEGDVPRAMLEICFDPQTSGGLLIAVSEAAADTLLARLRADGDGRGGPDRQGPFPRRGRVVVALRGTYATPSNFPTAGNPPQSITNPRRHPP